MPLRFKVKLKAENSSGEQFLYIQRDDKEDLIFLTLVGEYEGKDIQIDFDPIIDEHFADTLKILLSQLEPKKEE